MITAAPIEHVQLLPHQFFLEKAYGRSRRWNLFVSEITYGPDSFVAGPNPFYRRKRRAYTCSFVSLTYRQGLRPRRVRHLIAAASAFATIMYLFHYTIVPMKPSFYRWKEGIPSFCRFSSPRPPFRTAIITLPRVIAIDPTTRSK